MSYIITLSTEISIEENHIEESTTIPCLARDDLLFSAKAEKGKSTSVL
jgi:hypothetical protein